MLVIPRAVGESVMIGDYLEIGIEEVVGDKARIWIRKLGDQQPAELVTSTERVDFEDEPTQEVLIANLNIDNPAVPR